MDNEGTQPPPNPFEDVNVPRKGELSVGEVLNYLNRVRTEGRSRPGGWSHKDVQKLMEEDSNFEKLTLRGPAQVAKGESSVIAVHHDLGEALESMFDVDVSLHVILGKMYASVQKASNEKTETVEAELKYAGSLKPETPNHIVISQGLASQLGTDNQSDINITQVYQKPQDIDLDKL